MFFPGDVGVEVSEAEGDEVIIDIVKPAGAIQLLGSIRLEGAVLYVTNVHVQGLHPGALGRDGLNAIGRKLLSECNVEEIVIEGGTRTTGLRQGRKPRTIRFPRR